MISIADQLTNDERSAVEIAVRKTFADLNDEERRAAEIAIWRATHVQDLRIAMLASVGVHAIYSLRGQAARHKASQPRRADAPITTEKAP